MLHDQTGRGSVVEHVQGLILRTPPPPHLQRTKLMLSIKLALFWKNEWLELKYDLHDKD